MNPIGPVAVVGAGIAGLTAALALSRAGFTVTLLERAARLEAVGAGLQLSPNALRVLDRLGLLADLRKAGVAARSVRLRGGRTGRILAEVPVEARDGTAYLAIHRADLQAVLLRAVERETRIRIELGTELQDFEPGPEYVSLRLGTPDGEERRRFALVVGADGVRSRTAARLGLPPAKATGITAARFTASGDPARPLDRIEAWLGPKRHAVAYPMQGGEAVNVVLIAPDAVRIAEGFAGWDPELRALVERAVFTGKWPLAEMEAGRRLVHGERICLIGDAAHAMLPFAAQGAAMAIEDAFVLAHCLAVKPSLTDALRSFEAERLPRLERVRRRVSFHRFTYHLPFPLALARDAALSVRSAEALRSDLAWLYDWVPPSGAL